MAIAKMTTRGRITIPKQLRDQLGIRGGQVLDYIVDNGKITLVVAKVNQLSKDDDTVSAANK